MDACDADATGGNVEDATDVAEAVADNPEAQAGTEGETAEAETVVEDVAATDTEAAAA